MLLMGFQVIAVCLIFSTYTKVEILPGPGLNVVIGANGTGKSTIVCGICLGLAGKPSILNKQHTVSEFIKHGASNAIIEISLLVIAQIVEITTFKK